MDQTTFTEKLLKRFGMSDSKPVKTPVNPAVKLAPCKNDEDMYNQKLFEAAVSSLLYLSTKTHPDIAFAVSSIARFSTRPT